MEKKKKGKKRKKKRKVTLWTDRQEKRAIRLALKTIRYDLCVWLYGLYRHKFEHDDDDDVVRSQAEVKGEKTEVNKSCLLLSFLFLPERIVLLDLLLLLLPIVVSFDPISRRITYGRRKGGRIAQTDNDNAGTATTPPVAIQYLSISSSPRCCRIASLEGYKT